MGTTRIDRLFIQAEAQSFDLTREIRSRLPTVPVCIVREPPASDKIPGHSLYLAVQPGRFIREFDEAGPAAYHIAFQTGCHFKCAYCYLRTYLEQPQLVTVHVNHDQLQHEYAALPETPGLNLYAGVLTDSLLADDVTHYTRLLVALCRNHPQHQLELRTKTDNVAVLLEQAPPPNLTVTWTLNPEKITSDYEIGAAPLDARLAAMRRCCDRGFAVGFHIDPIIHIDGWQAAYHDLVERIFHVVAAGEISTMSIGALRFKKELVNHSDIFLDEFVPGQDGKYRYFKPLRLEMYRTILGDLRRFTPLEKITVCMEDRRFVHNLLHII
jgi:spore photoproduct lyase